MVLCHVQVSGCHLCTAHLSTDWLSVACAIFSILLCSISLCVRLKQSDFCLVGPRVGQPQRPTTSGDTQRRHCDHHREKNRQLETSSRSSSSTAEQHSTALQHSAQPHPTSVPTGAQPPHPQPQPPWTSRSPAARSHSRCRWRAGTTRDREQGREVPGHDGADRDKHRRSGAQCSGSHRTAAVVAAACAVPPVFARARRNLGADANPVCGLFAIDQTTGQLDFLGHTEVMRSVRRGGAGSGREG